MNVPEKLFVRVERRQDGRVVDARDLLVTDFWQVRDGFNLGVWWGNGRGEIHFSLVTGRSLERNIAHRLAPVGARALRRWLVEQGEGISFAGPGWFGHEGEGLDEVG